MSTLTVLKAFCEDLLSFTSCLELLAVLNDLKRVARLTGPVEDLITLQQSLKNTNLTLCIAPFHLEASFSNLLEDTFVRVVPGLAKGGMEGILFAGKARACVDAAIALESEGSPAGQAADLYGYPPCCARNYENAIQHGRHWVASFLRGMRGILRAPWPMNRFGRIFAPYVSLLPDYFPCHIACQSSLDLAWKYKEMLQRGGLAPLLDMAKTWLSRPVLHHDGCLYLVEALPGNTIGDKAFNVRIISTIAYAGQRLEKDILALDFDDGELTIRNSATGSGQEAEKTICIVFG
jgi:hypothetical protein